MMEQPALPTQNVEHHVDGWKLLVQPATLASIHIGAFQHVKVLKNLFKKSTIVLILFLALTKSLLTNML